MSRSAVSRGKVDVFVTMDATAADVSMVTVNRALGAAAMSQALSELAEHVRSLEGDVTPDDPGPVSGRSDRHQGRGGPGDRQPPTSVRRCWMRPWPPTMPCVPWRARSLAEDIAGRLDDHRDLHVGQVEERSPQTVAEYREQAGRPRCGRCWPSTTIDEQRILTEAAIFADKVAVDEETVRLRSHVAQLRTMLEADEPYGPEDGLPDPGGQPGVQHHRLQVQRRGHRPGRGGP